MCCHQSWTVYLWWSQMIYVGSLKKLEVRKIENEILNVVRTAWL